MNVDEHFNQAVDMVKIGNGSFRKVNICLLYTSTNTLLRFFKHFSIFAMNFSDSSVFSISEKFEGAFILE